MKPIRHSLMLGAVVACLAFSFVTSHASLVGMSGPVRVSASSSSSSSSSSSGGAAQPGNFDLELISPRASGTSGSADSGSPTFRSAHRVLKAYPGIEYNIKPVIMGGSYPFTCALSGGVGWLTVDEDTCVISGTAPVVANGTIYTPTLTVTDAQDTEVSAPWPITVTTVGFKFVDSVNDGSGDTGAIDAPYDSLVQLKAGSAAGDITYFRTGTYTVNGLTVNSAGGYISYNNTPGNWRRSEWNGASVSINWIGYPGETAVIDGGYTEGVEQGMLLRFQGNNTYATYMDDLEFTNFYHMAIQIVGQDDYLVFRRLNAHGIHNAFDGQNSAVIDSTVFTDDTRWYVAYTENHFHDNAVGGMKIYSQNKSLMADNLHEDNGGLGIDSGSDLFSGGPDHKGNPGRSEVRANVYANCPSSGIMPDGNITANDSGFGGNMHMGEEDPIPEAQRRMSGEVRFNKLGCFTRPGLRVVNLNNFIDTGVVYLYRNTGIGFWNVECSGTGGGELHYADNIIVSNDATYTGRISRTSKDECPGDLSGTIIHLGTGDNANLTYSSAASDGIVLNSTTLDLIGASEALYLHEKGAQP